MKHAAHDMHPNSLAAYRAEEAKLGRRALSVLEWVIGHGPATDRQVMQGLGFIEPNAVRPRVTELIGFGQLRECGSVTCPVTGKTVRLVEAVPVQARLFQ